MEISPLHPLCCSYYCSWLAQRQVYSIRYSSDANIGSQAGKRTGFCLSISRVWAGTYFLFTTRRNTYSLNQRSVIIRCPLTPYVGPQLFSTSHFSGFPSLSMSTAISVMACEELLSKLLMRCF